MIACPFCTVSSSDWTTILNYSIILLNSKYTLIGFNTINVPRAWIMASESPIAGVDQRCKAFFETLQRQFVEKAPVVSAGVEGWYVSYAILPVSLEIEKS